MLFLNIIHHLNSSETSQRIKAGLTSDDENENDKNDSEEEYNIKEYDE
jgi:hypothetical protein